MYQYSMQTYERGKVQKLIVEGMSKEEADAHVATEYPHLVYDKEVNLPLYVKRYGNVARYNAASKRYQHAYDEVYSINITTTDAYCKYAATRCVASKNPQKALAQLNQNVVTYYDASYEV